MSSCLLPQNDDPLPEIPPAKNLPPRIIAQQVNPARAILNNRGTNCQPPLVEIFVEDVPTDPDEPDRIRARWTVYLEDGTTKAVQPTLDSDPASAPIASIKAPNELFTLNLLATTGKGRRLEVIVGDGEFIIRNNEVTTLGRPVTYPDGGTNPEGNPTFTDTYSWVVDTVRINCP